MLPPTTGWLFKINKWWTGEFKKDPYLNCTLPSTLPPCCLTVTLQGAAKEAHGDCEGEYKSIGLISMGREVSINYLKKSLSINQSYPFGQVFKLEDSDHYYLFVRHVWLSWSIFSSLKAATISSIWAGSSPRSPYLNPEG